MKVTIVFMVLFFATSIILNSLATHAMKQSEKMSLPVPASSSSAVPPPVSPNSIPANVVEQPVPSRDR